MEVWRASVDCPTGGPYGGVAFSLQLIFDLRQGPEAWLPSVQIIAPACFHPNVGTDGTLCPLALQQRCKPIESVGGVLLCIAELLGRPAFSVRPRNEEAAASWYEDDLQVRIIEATRGAPPTPKRAMG
jgi:ubiquitin-protein ligase